MSAKNATELKLADTIRSQYLFASDFYEIKNWAFDFRTEKKINTGYNDCFCIVFVRNGNFQIDLPGKAYTMHTGHLIVEKADYTYKLRPTAGECSIFNFTGSFYNKLIEENNLQGSFFFSNDNLLSLLLKSSPEIDYLHHQILQQVYHAGKLEMDTLVFSLVQQIVQCFTDKPFGDDLPSSLMKNHIGTIEKAKALMNDKFAEDLSLQDLSTHVGCTPFHFCRTFKRITSYSPHQYLLNLRLKHAEMLVRNTTMPIADISFSSGFNSLEHFTTTFRQKYGVSPSGYRKL